MESMEVKQATPKWEYKVERPELKTIEEENDYLNKMGNEGWELFYIGEFYGEYYFKRFVPIQCWC